MKIDNRYESFIYMITNTITNKNYIGQTRSSIEMRWMKHKSDANRLSNKEDNILLHRSMRKYGIENFVIKEIEKIVTDSLEECMKRTNEAEIKYIELNNTLMPNGYNMTKGGDNTSIHLPVSVDAYFADGTLYKTYSSIAEAVTDIRGDVQIHAISDCCQGKSNSCIGYIWRYHGEAFDKYPIKVTQEMLDRYHNYIPVDQYSLDGKFINTYPTIKEALKQLNRPGLTLISACCKGKYKQAYGYVWRKSGDPFDKYQFGIPKDQSCVDVYDYYSESLIGTYESINEALRQLNLSLNYHSSCCINCNGQIKVVAKKYVFRYHGDPFDKFGNPKQRKKKEQKKICKYDLDGNFIEIIKSARNESIKNHYNSNAILLCCRNLRTNQSHEYNGYLWYYYDDPNKPDHLKNNA